MSDQPILSKLDELTEAISLWNVGMREVIESLETQATMLRDILQAVTIEPSDDSPLTQLLRQLVSTANQHTGQLSAIAASLDRLHQRLPG
jgi:hypothetical protein